MEHFKIEIQGGILNGAERYYKTKKAALIAAAKISDNPYETIYIDIYWLDENFKKHLITTKVK